MTHHGTKLLNWIVAFKVVKVVTLTTVGFALVHYARQDPVQTLTRLAAALHLPTSSRLFERALDAAIDLTIFQQHALAATAFGYAVVLSVEAVGLAQRRTWARWLTIGVTSSLLPFEIYEIIQKPTGWMRLLAFVVNAAIVVYLYQRKEEFHS